VFVISKNSSHGYIKSKNLKLCNIMFDYDTFAESMTEEIKCLPGFKSLFILEPCFRREHNFQSKLQLDLSSFGFVKNLLEVIFNEYNEGCNYAISVYFASLVTFLSRQYNSNRHKDTVRLLNLANAITFMENSFINQIHLEEISSKCFMSTRQFARVFKKSYGLTPTEYLIKLRLDYACKLMESTNLNLSGIALKSGFWDISFFSRQFKSKFGISPKEYRKSI
jgi:AraC-like DNA-binding protein